MVNDWTPYRHGTWRRVGDTVECIARRPTIPAGLLPAAPAQVLSYIDGTYVIRVRIKGWEAKTLIAV